MQMEVETDPAGGQDGVVRSRRSIQPRQRREINVRRALGEEENGLTNGEGSSGGADTSTTAAYKASRYTPILYVPEHQRKAAEQAAQTAHSDRPQYNSQLGSGSQFESRPQYGSGSQYAGSSAYGSYGAGGGALELYGQSGVDTHPPQRSRAPYSSHTAEAPVSESTLNTTRGVFKLRPRRNIRVQSFDELDAEGGSEKPPARKETTQESTYQTGFVRDTGNNQNERLARRGRQSISDMLGRTPASSYRLPAEQSRYGADPLGLQPIPALEAPPQLMEYGAPFHSDVPVLGQYSTGLDQYSVDPYRDMERYPPVGSEVNEMDEKPPPLMKASVEERLAKLRIGKTGIKHEPPKGITDDSDMEIFSGRTYGDESIHSSTALQLEPSANLGFSHSLSPDQVSLLRERFKAQPVQRPILPEEGSAPREETLDEKKARILGNLYQSKMNQMKVVANKPPSIYESLEEKKARIYANLQRKYNNLEPADLLGLSSGERTFGVSPDLMGLGSSSRRPGVFMRSKSLGDNLDPEPTDHNGAATYIPMDGDLQQEAYTKSELDHTTLDHHTPYSWVEPEAVQPRIMQGPPLYGLMDKVSNGHHGPMDNQRGEDGSPGQSPVEEVLSVDSGYHGRNGPDFSKDDSPNTSRAEIKHSNISSKKEMSPGPVVGTLTAKDGQPQKRVAPPVPSKHQLSVVPPKQEPKKIIVVRKGGEVDEASAKKTSNANAATNKQGPPTKPKPRPKSAPPSKSKSVTNLFDVTLSPRRERRLSTMSVARDAEQNEVRTRDRRSSSVRESDMPDLASPFSRNSRVRSSTKAWEMRQAENMAKIKAQAQIRSGSNTPTKGAAKPTPVKKPAGVVTGKVSLSEERARSPAKDKPVHTPRNVDTYEKPWRTGSTLSKTSTSTFFPARVPDKPVESKTPRESRTPKDGTSASSSRAASPPGMSGRPPKNPVKEQGSVEQGYPRSPSLVLKNSPFPSTPAKPQSNTEPNQRLYKTDRRASHCKSSTPSRPTPKKVTTPKPFNFSYIPRRRRGSVSSDGTDVSLDDFLSFEADFNSQEDCNLSDISDITSNLRQLADNWHSEGREDLTVISPDSAVFSETPGDSRPLSPGSVSSMELLDDITPPFILRNMQPEPSPGKSYPGNGLQAGSACKYS